MKKYLIKYPIAILIFPIAFLFVIIVRIISPLIIIRWGDTISTRIGHFAENINVYMCEKNLGLHKNKNKLILDIFYTRSKVCNFQLFKMWKRKIFFLPSLYMHVVNYINEYIVGYIFKTNLHDLGYYRKIDDLNFRKNNPNNKNVIFFPPIEAFDPFNSQDKSDFILSFTKEEKIYGDNKLKEFGIDKNKKIVNIILRDMDYLKTNYPETDWSYHEIRYSPYSYYKQTAEKLAEMGYKVIVIGASKADFENQNTNNSIINYSNTSLKSDFMDIYINYICEFAISSANGLDAIPTIFRKPVIEVAVAPLELIKIYSKNIKILFKTYYSKSLNRKLNLEEIFELGLYNVPYKISDEIELIHPSSDEILDATIELQNEISGNLVFEKDDINLEELFKKNYNHFCEKFNPKKKVAKFSSSVAKKFLKNNKYLLETKK